MLAVVLAWIACVAPSLAYLLATNLVSSPSLSNSCLFILGDNFTKANTKKNNSGRAFFHSNHFGKKKSGFT